MIVEEECPQSSVVTMPEEKDKCPRLSPLPFLCMSRGERTLTRVSNKSNDKHRKAGCKWAGVTRQLVFE